MPVTLKDVAQKAGVSLMTVSRALNDKDDVSDKTRDFIKSIAQELHYTPDGLAKSLVTRKTNTIGILIPGMNTYFAEIIDGISKIAGEQGYGIILCNSHEDPDEELALIRHLLEKRVDGILIYPVQEDDRYLDAFRALQVPYVFLNRYSDALPCNYVVSDNQTGAFSAVNFLVQQGYKRIVYICAKPTASSGRARMAGCKLAMSENDVPDHSLHIIYCEETMQSCYDSVKELLASDRDVDALFVWDDRLAVAAIKAIAESGKRIPEDLAIIGYDDIEFAAYMTPPLTTVKQPSFKIGETATRILLENLSSEPSELQQIVFEPELVIRESTRINIRNTL